MTKFPNDDERLVDFLRQHAGEAPTAVPDLEQLIIQSVAISPPKLARHRQLWVVPPAIAAGLLIAWTGYRVLMPTSSFSAAQLASLNAFLENNWDNGVLGSSADAQTFPLSPTNN